MVTTSEPSREPAVAVFCVVMMVLSISAVILRIWSRLTSKKLRFWWDDWCAIASLPLVLATLSEIFLSVSTGLGHPESQLDPQKLSLALKYNYVHTFLYFPAVTMPKYSALLFYVRVFGFTGSSGLFRANILLAAGLVTVWLLFAVPLCAFQCTPIRNIWLPMIPGHCIKSTRWFTGTAVWSVIVDVYIMLLPLPILWSLHAGRNRKTRMTGFFFCAYCVIICSLGRLVATVQLEKKMKGDWTGNIVTLFLWTAAEITISVVSICLPNMVQLFRRAHRHGTSALFTTREYAVGPLRRAKTGLGGSALAQQGKRGFHRIIAIDDTAFAVDDDLPLDTKDQGCPYRVIASAPQHRSDEREIVALDQVHLRQSVDVRKCERWATI